MDNKPPTVVFISGYGRSGSTILDLLFSQIDRVAVTGEIRHLFNRVMDDDELCNCGTPVLKCDYWSKVIEVAFPYGFDQEMIAASMRKVNTVFSFLKIRFPKLQSKKFSSQIKTYNHAFERVYSAIAEVNNAEVIIDSSKYPTHGAALADKLGDRLKNVLLVRDPRAVAYSWERPKIRPEIHHEERYMPKHNFIRSALAWNVSGYLSRKINSNSKTISYEAIVKDPVTTMSDILEYSGHKSYKVNEDLFLIESMRDYHKVAGNPLGLKTGKLELRKDEKWHSMPLIKKIIINLICSRGMREHGYRWRTV